MDEPELCILYIDDSKAALLEVQSVLAQHGYRVCLAQDVGEAIAFADSFDVVIIDYHLGGIDGAEALKQLLGHRTNPVRALHYLYTVDTAVATKARELGFDGAFTWKGNPEALVSQLQSAARILKMRRFVGARKQT